MHAYQLNAFDTPHLLYTHRGIHSPRSYPIYTNTCNTHTRYTSIHIVHLFSKRRLGASWRWKNVATCEILCRLLAKWTMSQKRLTKFSISHSFINGHKSITHTVFLVLWASNLFVNYYYYFFFVKGHNFSVKFSKINTKLNSRNILLLA